MTIDQSLNSFEAISLKEMDTVRLMNRIDTKYVVSRKLLPQILNKIKENYFTLEIDDERVFAYNSLYYDTYQNDMYLAHHNGKVNRFKVRMRKYVANELCFLEIKQKIKGSRTLKHRKKIENIETLLSDNSKEYISRFTPFKDEDLEPKIYTNFSRVTLVGKALNERVTMDMNLKFHYKDNNRELEEVVIIELKRDGNAAHSHLVDALNLFRIFPQGFSKYCIGRAMIEEEIKNNIFKERINKINKINDGVHFNRYSTFS